MHSADLDLPDFLRISAEERRAAWEANPPKPMPRFDAPQKAEDPTTIALRQQLEAERKAKTAERIAALRARFPRGH